MTLDVGDAPEVIAINPDHLRSAVGNLADNAVRHGAGAPVELRLGSEQGRLRVDVTDHGEGISEGNRDRIFDRFFTTARDSGGSGLGLSIVHAVAQSRGGRVGFDSLPGETTFTLVL